MLVVKYKCMVAMVLFITLRYLKVTQVTKKKTTTTTNMPSSRLVRLLSILKGNPVVPETPLKACCQANSIEVSVDVSVVTLA